MDMILVFYVIGLGIALILGLLELKFEEMHSYNKGADLQVEMLAPLALLSWVSVILLLVYRHKQLRWAIWWLMGL